MTSPSKREALEDWVQRWLQANQDAEAAGDWKPLAEFYTEDATYGWNIGPKEDVMCVNKSEIRDVALGLEMEGLENWVYEYQKVLIDEKHTTAVVRSNPEARDAFKGIVNELLQRIDHESKQLSAARS